jgi:hypothetical protein
VPEPVVEQAASAVVLAALKSTRVPAAALAVGDAGLASSR